VEDLCGEVDEEGLAEGVHVGLQEAEEPQDAVRRVVEALVVVEEEVSAREVGAASVLEDREETREVVAAFPRETYYACTNRSTPVLT